MNFSLGGRNQLEQNRISRGVCSVCGGGYAGPVYLSVYRADVRVRNIEPDEIVQDSKNVGRTKPIISNTRAYPIPEPKQCSQTFKYPYEYNIPGPGDHTFQTAHQQQLLHRQLPPPLPPTRPNRVLPRLPSGILPVLPPGALTPTASLALHIIQVAGRLASSSRTGDQDPRRGTQAPILLLQFKSEKSLLPSQNMYVLEKYAANMWPIHVVLSKILLSQYSSQYLANIRPISPVLAGFSPARFCLKLRWS
ncbi:hypothetical protein B0H13DRAFT_1883307 [Mycena leptocephala]|nr:hypothetical protein B0H13DRAFT_1883307 [Mycena leptocephala]